MIIWILYCVLDGVDDGYYYYFKDPRKAGKVNEHTFKLAIRVLFGLAISTNPVVLASFALMQPFLHNNAYYNTRHLLDGSYELGLFNQSTTSTAKLTKLMNPIVRIILFVGGISLYICKIKFF